MKRKVILGALGWIAFISLVHIQMNIGWAHLRDSVTSAFAGVRQEMGVGFLPVT